VQAVGAVLHICGNILAVKGTARRKKKVVHKTAATDEKKLQSNLKKLSVTNIPGIEEVNMIKEDGLWMEDGWNHPCHDPSFLIHVAVSFRDRHPLQHHEGAGLSARQHILDHWQR